MPDLCILMETSSLLPFTINPLLRVPSNQYWDRLIWIEKNSYGFLGGRIYLTSWSELRNSEFDSILDSLSKNTSVRSLACNIDNIRLMTTIFL